MLPHRHDIRLQYEPQVAAVQHAIFIVLENGLYNPMAVEARHRATWHFTPCEVQFFPTPDAALDRVLRPHN